MKIRLRYSKMLRKRKPDVPTTEPPAQLRKLLRMGTDATVTQGTWKYKVCAIKTYRDGKTITTINILKKIEIYARFLTNN